MESYGNHRRDLGKRGEEIACETLVGMGHVILERNWRSGHLEVDIISYNPEGIHFVEVKARSQSIQAPPQESVDRNKQRRIVKAAQSFLRTGRGLPYRDNECFFDIVAVTVEGDEVRTEWFPQAFIPIYL